VAELSRPGEVAAEEAEARPRAAAPVRRLDIVSRRNIFFLISLIIIIPGIVSMVTRGFLLGIDFQGGSAFFVSFSNRPSQQVVAAAAAGAGVNAQVQQTTQGTFIIRTSPLDPTQSKRFTDDLSRRVGATASIERQDQVGGTIASETVTKALGAIVAASTLILLYLAFRFRRVQGGWRSGFQFGGSALLALLHDVFLLAGVFSILGRFFNLRVGEIDGFFVTAVLTVVGFSVHDTIVVFDRIRENMVVSSRLTFEQVVNLSIMQTAARSIITSFTVVLVLLSLLVFGGDTLKGFALALLVGIISGTYSSIFNASPLLVVWRRLQPVR
jgi:preprotein translocase subunit SecF